MKPGRKPIPDNVVKLNGGDKTQHRSRPDSIKTDTEIPPCPAWLSKYAKQKWKEITKELARYHLIASLDRDALTIYCDSYGIFREMCEHIQKLTGVNVDDPEKKTFGTIQLTPQNYKTVSAYWIVRTKAAEQMIKIGEQFGLSPSARVRVSPENPNQGQLNFD